MPEDILIKNANVWRSVASPCIDGGAYGSGMAGLRREMGTLEEAKPADLFMVHPETPAWPSKR